MKKFLFDWLDPTRFLNGVILMFVGMLIITGGRVGIQISSEDEVTWIEAFGKMDAWIGWMVVCFALDSMLAGGRAITFLLSKTVTPVVRAVLSNILGEERLNAFMKRFEKKVEKVEKSEKSNVPLTLVAVRDLTRRSSSQVVMTKQAYEQTADSVLDYARQCRVEIVIEEGGENEV